MSNYKDQNTKETECLLSPKTNYNSQKINQISEEEKMYDKALHDAFIGSTFGEASLVFTGILLCGLVDWWIYQAR
jgi:hypothetical protein